MPVAPVAAACELYVRVRFKPTPRPPTERSFCVSIKLPVAQLTGSPTHEYVWFGAPGASGPYSSLGSGAAVGLPPSPVVRYLSHFLSNRPKTLCRQGYVVL